MSEGRRKADWPVIAALVVAGLFAAMMLYVGSYLALVLPQGRAVSVSTGNTRYWTVYQYRLDSGIPPLLFWPLEQIDRKVRPQAWTPNPAYIRT